MSPFSRIWNIAEALPVKYCGIPSQHTTSTFRSERHGVEGLANAATMSLILTINCLKRSFRRYTRPQNPHLRPVNCGFSGFASLKYLLVATLGIVSKLSLPSLKRNLENPLFIRFINCIKVYEQFQENNKRLLTAWLDSLCELGVISCSHPRNRFHSHRGNRSCNRPEMPSPLESHRVPRQPQHRSSGSCQPLGG